jgi:hypothetical protein
MARSKTTADAGEAEREQALRDRRERKQEERRVAAALKADVDTEPTDESGTFPPNSL